MCVISRARGKVLGKSIHFANDGINYGGYESPAGHSKFSNVGFTIQPPETNAVNQISLHRLKLEGRETNYFELSSLLG